MHSRVGSQFSGLAWVFEDLDHALVGTKSGALIEGKCCRMVEMAGMHPEAGDRFLPGLVNRDIHQDAPGASTDQALVQPEKGEFAIEVRAATRFTGPIRLIRLAM